MMATTRILAAPTLALTLGLIFGQAADAAPIAYNTSGFVDLKYYLYNDPLIEFPNDPRNVVGPDVISFQGVSAGSLESSGPFQLGEFVISPVAGSSSTYDHTPFDIEVNVPSLYRFVGPYDSSDPHESGFHYGNLVIRGYLNGTIDGSGRSDVVATFDSARLGTVSGGPFATVGYHYEFPYPLPDVKLSGPISLASESGGGTFAVAAEISPVPEPTPIALFLATAAGLAYRRSRRTMRV